eukprot:TRINITY_DN7267_c0_g1_i1.p1 TRINITY_DN7267_c0_g1~~TRINITY_DN7267_c0_g1_i1.p1  ORF type:complete len:104 (+),score=11.19 TRINITY_DN7267_c0_g1_i1:34-345(+)
MCERGKKEKRKKEKEESLELFAHTDKKNNFTTQKKKKKKTFYFSPPLPLIILGAHVQLPPLPPSLHRDHNKPGNYFRLEKLFLRLHLYSSFFFSMVCGWGGFF